MKHRALRSLSTPPMPAAQLAISYDNRLFHLALCSVQRSAFSTSRRAASSGHFSRSDFQGQPFTGSYEPGQPTRGPLAEASPHGAPRITPKRMKEYLDKYVVGQEAAKKRLCVAVYNHYQRIRELQRRDEEEQARDAEMLRKEMMREKYSRNSHPTENEYPGQVSTVDYLESKIGAREDKGISTARFEDEASVTIEKSNIMVLGPTGVGKTLMIKLLARFLEVPFSMSDCTPFTQAGYVGDDAEVCVHRLFAESGNNVTDTEHGIIYLDEVDKIAMSKTLNGKDVSGEGVQQALLKLIEGTTLQINAKTDRSNQRVSNNINTFNPGFTSSTQSSTQGSQKGETYSVRTDNILFIFSGAFVGLHKIILDRLSRGSIGFGAPIRSASNSANPLTLPASDAFLFRKRPLINSTIAAKPQEYNPLDLVTPSDFQKFGLIPEFVGRIPITTALSSLTLTELVRILTEPRNNLVQQFVALFAQESIELRISTGAIHEIAKEGLAMGTGARGLRSAMEDLLAETMYDAFGSSVRYVLVTAAAARYEAPCGFWGRGQAVKFRSAIAKEEEEWEESQKGVRSVEEAEVGSFEEFREKAISGM